MSDPQVRSRFHDLRRAQAGQRRAMIVLAVAAVGELLIFGFLSYTTVQRNLRPAALREAAAPAIEELRAPVRREAADILRAVGPRYARLGAEKLQTIAPELEKRAVNQAQKMVPVLHRKLQREIQKMLDRLTKRARADLVERFPSLQKGHRLRELVKGFRQSVDAESRKVAGHVRKLFRDELERTFKALEGLDLPAPDKTEHRSLQKRAVHNAVMLLDAELMRLFEGDKRGGSASNPKEPSDE